MVASRSMEKRLGLQTAQSHYRAISAHLAGIGGRENIANQSRPSRRFSFRAAPL